MLEIFDEMASNSLINVETLDLRDKIILVNFWTYTSSKCLRNIDPLNSLHMNYSDKDLVVIGVHTPEFEFEKDPENVKNAVVKLGIKYPVVIDSEYQIWTYFNNTLWPAFYLFNKEGELVYELSEGDGLEEITSLIASLAGSDDVAVIHGNDTGTTRETYLGSMRGSIANEHICQLGKCNYYPEPLEYFENEVYLKGNWNIEPEYIESDSDESSIIMKFTGKEINLVLNTHGIEKLKIVTDKREREIEISGPDGYNLFSYEKYDSRSIKIWVPKGVKCYALTIE